jgi:NAD-dependent dihydropyrimidine dehydrogenase PreA subunit
MEPPMTYAIAEPCIDVKDKACTGECAAGCICEGERMLCIHPGECAGWGACEPVRAVEAIFYKDDVPGQWTQFTVENAKFFDQLARRRRQDRAAALRHRLRRQLRRRPVTASCPRPILDRRTAKMLTLRRFRRTGATAMTLEPGQDPPAGRAPVFIPFPASLAAGPGKR